MLSEFAVCSLDQSEIFIFLGGYEHIILNIGVHWLKACRDLLGNYSVTLFRSSGELSFCILGKHCSECQISKISSHFWIQPFTIESRFATIQRFDMSATVKCHESSDTVSIKSGSNQRIGSDRITEKKKVIIILIKNNFTKKNQFLINNLNSHQKWTACNRKNSYKMVCLGYSLLQTFLSWLLLVICLSDQMAAELQRFFFESNRNDINNRKNIFFGLQPLLQSKQRPK